VAIAAAIETQSLRADKADKALRDDISALRKQTSALDSAVSSHTSSLSKHGADIARVDAKVEKEVRPLLAALGAGKR
jgi:septal ring factor EnvC (AmiA/AmiB activator)